METLKDIPLEDLTLALGQARTKLDAQAIDELADSIKVIGLIEPIVVTQSQKEGKYEILAGQRRFLACKRLKKKTIAAIVKAEKVDEYRAKAISVTENVVREDLNSKELIDACTALFKKYGSIPLVCEATGLPDGKVRLYVKYDRLGAKLKKLVDEGGVKLQVALRAQDAAAAAADGPVDEDEAVTFAKEMTGMSGAQQLKIVKQRRSNPDVSASDVIENAKTGSKITQVLVTLSATVHSSLQSFARAEGQNQDDAAGALIEEGLQRKGF